MARIDGEIAGERTAERLVRGDQRLQSLVDLSVLSLAPLLHGVHDEQADADRDQRDDDQAKQRRQHALPGAEVERAAHQDGGCNSAARGRQARVMTTPGSALRQHDGPDHEWIVIGIFSPPV